MLLLDVRRTTMPMVKKSISVTDQQDHWIKAQIESGHYGNESEIIRELIRERQIREQESASEIEAIRAALRKGEQSGFSDRSIDEIWEEARRHHKASRG
jgi:antitoxin ParD1/3/4